MKTIEEALGKKSLRENLRENLREKPASSIQILWKKQVSMITGVYQYRLSAKEIGILNNLKKNFGDKHLECLEFAFANWVKFIWKVRSDAGVTSLPSVPQMGFLLVHYRTLLQLIAEQKTEPVVEAKVPTIYVVETQVETPHVLTQEQQQQLEEARAMMANMDNW